jgi:hypothetical protein
MLRVFILIVAILAFRALLPRKRSGSPTATSPYMNSLDSLMSVPQVSSERGASRRYRVSLGKPLPGHPLLDARAHSHPSTSVLSCGQFIPGESSGWQLR